MSDIPRSILIKFFIKLGWKREQLEKYSTEELMTIFSEVMRIEGLKY